MCRLDVLFIIKPDASIGAVIIDYSVASAIIMRAFKVIYNPVYDLARSLKIVFRYV
jgi:hypothetical protein